MKYKDKSKEQLINELAILRRNITELEKTKAGLKHKEEMLRERERFLEDIFMSIQDGISILDKDMNIVRVNQTMEKWYSHAIPLIGKKCYKAYHGRSQRCELCPTHRCLETGKAGHEVVPRIGVNGGITGWLDLYAFPLFDITTGQMKGVIEYVRDITDRKTAEEKLRQSEERYRRLVETSPDAITLTDLNGNIIITNQQAALLHGFKDPKEMISRFKNAFSIITLKDRQRAFDNAKKTLEVGYVKNIEYDIFKKDGTSIPVEINVSVIRDAYGNPTGFIGVVRDITERKKIEAAVRESEEKYRILMNEASDAILLADFEGNISEVNKKAEQLLGYSAQEFLKINITQLHPQESLKRVISAFKKMIQKGLTCLNDVPVLKKDGTIVYVDITGSVIKYAGKSLLQGIFRDITERKKTEAMLEQARQDLEMRVQKRTMELVRSNIALADEITERKRIEKALRESEDKYRTIFENTGTAMVIIEADTIISLANAEMEKLSGYARVELEGKKSWVDFVDKDDRKRLREYHRARRLNPKTAPRNYEFKFVDREGKVKNVFATVALIPGTKKSVASFMEISKAWDRM